MLKLKQSKDAVSYWNFSNLWVILRASRRALKGDSELPVFLLAAGKLNQRFSHI
jgi:hypothetical protein